MIHKAAALKPERHKIVPPADHYSIDRTFCGRLIPFVRKAGEIMRPGQILRGLPHRIQIQVVREMIAVTTAEHIRPFPDIHIIFIGFPHGALPRMESVLYKLRVKDADILRQHCIDLPREEIRLSRTGEDHTGRLP